MNKKKITFIFVILILALILFSFFRSSSQNTKYSKTSYYLGTVNEVTVFNIKESKSDKILNECDSILRYIDNKMSTHIPGSDVSKINDNAGKKFVRVSDDTFFVVKEAIQYSKLSDGYFDITIGPLSNLWAIGTDKAKVPSDSEIQKLLPLIDYKNIILDEKNKSIKLTKENMKIDLGAIAKGYAADKIVAYLKSEDVKKGLVNLGGNIFTLEDGKNDKPFKIGIQDPTSKNGESIGNIETTNKSVVTSGIYERFIEKDGKIYHHMLNPFTGYPFENNLSSVTIISDKSINCDALSTSTFGLGLEKGMDLINKIDNVDAIFITKDKKVYLTKGIKDNFKLTDKSFSIEKLNKQ
ncbi:FAD:protein FMN transferase [Clostridioides difficile]|nr:FAD:protein FMN transferase [Clostridioides difficile]HBH3439622.1 FAD:protein FMN transferase [Clostridioides difficile]